MHQSTTPSLSQTIWPRWASRLFVTLLIVQTLVPVTFGYSLSSEAVIMRQLRRWKLLWWRSLTRSHKRTSIGPSRTVQRTLQPIFMISCSNEKLLQELEYTLLKLDCHSGWISKMQSARVDYFKGSFICVLPIKVPIWKKVWKLI